MSNTEKIPTFPLVSVLFITYRRVDLLKMSLEAFRRNTDYPNIEIVIADDGSGQEIQAQIRMLKADIYALSPTNRGLGANNNNGISHCKGKYILMIQDDWECCGPPEYLTNTIRVMEANPEIGIINYCGEPNPIDETRPVYGSDEYCVISKASRAGGLNGRVRYSDQPHVVSRAALDLVGSYIEDRSMDEGECEEHHHAQWVEQTTFIGAVFPKYYMATYVNRGLERSFRTSRGRHRIIRRLAPAASYLKANVKPVYVVGKASVRSFLKIAAKLHVIR